ncbi:alpha/beta fold hydrolase [Bacillus sp. Marseille-P3661]|uniref:alpha/beta fold hydrolase n=1 Tax=Bacillus sp. Marseille-P3661 TaxID=1936234 RepID=UPI000C8600E4|nr:alpha/beta fold hydrolase [Bacillus sp. Marseille-P3661]
MSPTQLTFEELDINGKKIRYQEKGTGEPLLFLHDYNGVTQWHSFQEQLSANYRVIALELPGFGESQRPDWLTKMDDLSFYLLDILDNLKVERVNIVGHSLGGWLSADFASRYSARVKNLILVDSMGLYRPDLRIPDLYMISSEEHNKLRYFNSENKVERELEFLELARAQAMTSRLAWTPRFHDPKLKFRLHRIKAPTLIVWGKEDKILSARYAEEFKKYIAHAQIQYVEESSHVPQLEQADYFVKMVTAFLERH